MKTGWSGPINLPGANSKSIFPISMYVLIFPHQNMGLNKWILVSIDVRSCQNTGSLKSQNQTKGNFGNQLSRNLVRSESPFNYLFTHSLSKVPTSISYLRCWLKPTFWNRVVLWRFWRWNWERGPPMSFWSKEVIPYAGFLEGSKLLHHWRTTNVSRAMDFRLWGVLKARFLAKNQHIKCL